MVVYSYTVMYRRLRPRTFFLTLLLLPACFIAWRGVVSASVCHVASVLSAFWSHGKVLDGWCIIDESKGNFVCTKLF